MNKQFLPALFALCLSLSSVARGQSDAEYIDISLAPFQMNLPQDAAARQDIYPVVRSAESFYFPSFLRLMLVESDLWGAIRLVPEPDDSSELMITGSIIHSDGTSLELAIRAVDSTGRSWIDRSYTGIAVESVSLSRPDILMDPFLGVYNSILNDLQAIHDSLDAADIRQIKSMSELRYAALLSPESFGDYVEETPEDRYVFSRLPASNDPMLQRVGEIREHEYLFIDTVDEQYQDYFVNIKPVYDLWRKYRKEQMETSSAFEQRETNAESDFRPGSYRALRESYDNFRWAKMQQQYLSELSAGFSNEVQPTSIDLEDSLYRLSGTLEEQYAQWRSILKELFELEAR